MTLMTLLKALVIFDTLAPVHSRRDPSSDDVHKLQISKIKIRQAKRDKSNSGNLVLQRTNINIRIEMC